MAATGAASRRRDRGMATVLATFDDVRAMTWRLLNPMG
jgi:hypothetical protein